MKVNDVYGEGGTANVTPTTPVVKTEMVQIKSPKLNAKTSSEL